MPIARHYICSLVLLLTLALIPQGAAKATTFFPTKVRCPIGGEEFEHFALSSYTTWGALPDGMPLGTGPFPTNLPQCPSNGLIMYRDFTADEIAKITPFIQGPAYQALQAAGETPYYLAYRTAKFLGDDESVWLLLRATWEAKNGDAKDERATRYNEEFVAAVSAVPSDATSLSSIALRARAANALRELGRFAEAEALRSAITIAPDAGGSAEDAAQNRAGWATIIASLAAPITRQDRSRAPIDLANDQQVVMRCLERELAAKNGWEVPPALTEFEAAYCATPKYAALIERERKAIAESE